MNYYVYILESISNPERYYVGFTINLKKRIDRHNQGRSIYTSKYIPWKLTTAISFTDKKKAYRFEKYLKSHSGRAFSKKHF